MARCWSRPSGRSELGFTLAEMIVTSVLTLVVLLMAYQILRVTTSTAQAVGYQASNATNARIALADLEANLRYANGYWIHSSIPTVSNTGVYNPSAEASSSSTQVFSQQPVLIVSNSSGTAFGGQPACAEWYYSGAGLYEVKDATGGTSFGTPSLVMAGVTAITFTDQLPRLLEIDLTENPQGLSTVKQGLRSSANAVSVRDLISPDNLSTSQAATTECY